MTRLARIMLFPAGAHWVLVGWGGRGGPGWVVERQGGGRRVVVGRRVSRQAVCSSWTVVGPGGLWLVPASA